MFQHIPYDAWVSVFSYIGSPWRQQTLLSLLSVNFLLRSSLLEYIARDTDFALTNQIGFHQQYYARSTGLVKSVTVKSALSAAAASFFRSVTLTRRARLRSDVHDLRHYVTRLVVSVDLSRLESGSVALDPNVLSNRFPRIRSLRLLGRRLGARTAEQDKFRCYCMLDTSSLSASSFQNLEELVLENMLCKVSTEDNARFFPPLRRYRLLNCKQRLHEMKLDFSKMEVYENCLAWNNNDYLERLSAECRGTLRELRLGTFVFVDQTLPTLCKIIENNCNTLEVISIGMFFTQTETCRFFDVLRNCSKLRVLDFCLDTANFGVNGTKELFEPILKLQKALYPTLTSLELGQTKGHATRPYVDALLELCCSDNLVELRLSNLRFKSHELLDHFYTTLIERLGNRTNKLKVLQLSPRVLTNSGNQSRILSGINTSSLRRIKSIEAKGTRNILDMELFGIDNLASFSLTRLERANEQTFQQIAHRLANHKNLCSLGILETKLMLDASGSVSAFLNALGQCRSLRTLVLKNVILDTQIVGCLIDGITASRIASLSFDNVSVANDTNGRGSLTLVCRLVRVRALQRLRLTVQDRLDLLADAINSTDSMQFLELKIDLYRQEQAEESKIVEIQSFETSLERFLVTLNATQLVSIQFDLGSSHSDTSSFTAALIRGLSARRKAGLRDILILV